MMKRDIDGAKDQSKRAKDDKEIEGTAPTARAIYDRPKRIGADRTAKVAESVGDTGNSTGIRHIPQFQGNNAGNTIIDRRHHQSGDRKTD